jgi:hypothetical protein
MQMPCGKILRHIFLIYAVSGSDAAYLKFETTHFKQGIPRLNFQRLIPYFKCLAAPISDQLQI